MEMFKELSRQERMNEMLEHVNAMLRRIRPDRCLAVNYLNADEENIKAFSEWDRTRLCILPHNEYFVVMEWENASTKAYILYAVNISMDSELTAMEELFHLLSYKF